MKKSFFLFVFIFIFLSCGNYTTNSGIKVSENLDEPDEVTTDFEQSDENIDIDDEITDEYEPDEEQDDENSFITIPVCGNGKVEGTEVCDGGTIDCEELGFISGTAFCKSDCSGWNTATCVRECEENILTCDGSIVKKCISGKWTEFSDCSDESKVCRGGRCIDHGEIDPRLDFEGPVFKGDKVLVYHYSTNGYQNNFSGTLSTTTLFSDNNLSYKIPDIPRMDFRPPVPDYLGKPSIVTEKLLLHEPVKSFAIGDKDTFYIYNFQTGGNRAVMATLRNVGKYCEVWVTDEGVFVSDSKIQDIVDEFDSVIYYLVTENFYDVADIDGNGVVSILLADLGGGAAGYITKGDLFTKEEYSQSNFRDLVYIEKSMSTSDINSTIVHELQHLAHANRNILIEGDWDSDNLSYRWIDEGLATAAQHMYEGPQTTWLTVLNHNYYNGPVRDGNSFLYWDYFDHNKVYSDYAMAYVFIQYLRIQSGNKTSIYREIIECTTNDYRCVENIVKKYVDPEYTLSDFIVDFRITLILQDDSGPYSFAGESAFKFTIPAFTRNSVNLRGGGGVFINSDNSFMAPSDAGQNIIFVGIDTQ